MRPTRGSSSTSSATASATVTRTGATWNRSTIGTGPGCQRPDRGAAAAARRLVPSSRSGTRPAKRSSGPTRRGKERSASSARRLNTAATSLNVLHSSRRASSRSRSSHRASSSSRSTSSAPGSRRRALSSTSVAAISRNSVATSRSSCLHALDLVQVGVDDRRQDDLVDVDLLLQDQLQEQVERALVDRCRRHRSPSGPDPTRRKSHGCSFGSGSCPTDELRRNSCAPSGLSDS